MQHRSKERLLHQSKGTTTQRRNVGKREREPQPKNYSDVRKEMKNETRTLNMGNLE